MGTKSWESLWNVLEGQDLVDVRRSEGPGEHAQKDLRCRGGPCLST